MKSTKEGRWIRTGAVLPTSAIGEDRLTRLRPRHGFLGEDRKISELCCVPCAFSGLDVGKRLTMIAAASAAVKIAVSTDAHSPPNTG
jgi:hypothetical protein